MKKSRVLVMIATAVALLLVTGFAFSYLAQHGMKPSPSYESGVPSLPHHVLIATQGSPFKDRLVQGLVAQLAARATYVKVIDVTDLSGIQEKDWQAIVILHTWEIGKPPGAVSAFVARAAERDKIIDVTTSGSGREKLPGIDAMSSASVVDDVSALVMQIGTKVDVLLTKQSPQ
jgi:hypothetical protein